ncbi:MAG: cyclase family protein [Gammaproteobacteria bacterium]
MIRKAMLSPLIICTALLGSFNTSAEQWSPPAPEKRCPSQWGASDERGAANHMKPQTVLKGIRLIKEGKMYELGRVLESAMPNFGTRRYAIHTARSFNPPSGNKLLGNEELVITELGQIGTQFDALPHIAIGDLLYNCIRMDDIVTGSGFKKLGVENLGGIVTRGVLLDVAALKGVEMLEAGYEITVADLKEAMKRQGVSLTAGDAVLIHTGWGKLWMKDNARYLESEPGVGIPAAEWLAGANPILVGSDNMGIEVYPHANKDLLFPVHQIMITTHGVFLLENLDLDALVSDKAYEFAFVVLPLKIKGGTGSTVAPIAIK